MSTTQNPEEFSSAQLEAALVRLAELVEADLVFLPIFERIEQELLRAKAREQTDPVQRVRHMLAAKKGLALAPS